MSILSEWFAGGSTARKVTIVEISSDTQGRLFYYPGYEDISVRLETGEWVDVEASSVEVAYRKRDNSGSQEVTFGFSNVTPLVMDYINEANDSRSTVRVTVREYLSDDLAQPDQERIIKTEVTAGRILGDQAIFKCGHFDIINVQFNRTRYIASKYPGLRYMR